MEDHALTPTSWRNKNEVFSVNGECSESFDLIRARRELKQWTKQSRKSFRTDLLDGSNNLIHYGGLA